jgi:hypothetical protein
MYVGETVVSTEFVRSSKFGKLVTYCRNSFVAQFERDLCIAIFTRAKTSQTKKNAKTFCPACVALHGVAKIAGIVGYEAKIKKSLGDRVGFKKLSRSGYPEVYIGKDYPYQPGGYRSIREHVYLMECYLKRGLNKGEVVHHIDGDKQNNDMSNLFLTTVAVHNKLHAASESIIFELVKSGVVLFNRTTSRYELIRN